MEDKILKVKQALEKNNIEVFCANNKNDIVDIVKQIVPKAACVSCGGSVTLSECNVTELLKSGYYDFLDRSKDSVTAEQIEEIYRKTFGCDAFFTSANAVTENGELYCVDGNANRVAAITYGPEKVIFIVGANKIVKDIPAAVKRVKEIAAPLNAKRLGLDTPCAKLGKCPDDSMTFGCDYKDRICISYYITAFQRKKDRIKVILCNDSLGY